MNKQSIQHLLQEHARARRTMQTLEVLLASLTQDPQWSAARAEAFDKIRGDLTRDLCRLIQKENKLLYPLLEPHFERDSGALANLRAELQAYHPIATIENALLQDSTNLERSG